MFTTKKELIKELEDIDDDAKIFIYGIPGPHFIKVEIVDNVLGYSFDTELPKNNIENEFNFKNYTI